MTPPFTLPAHLRVIEPTLGNRTVKATDLLRRRSVSLKWAANRREALALKQEWQLLSGLSSRFVPTPHELVRLQDHTLLTADWIEGQPLDQYLPSARPPDQVAAVADALAGLDHLHRAGLCHRDIRARNLLIARRPSGPRAIWLDLEHSVTAQSLASGAYYVAGKPPGAERGGDVFNPQHDIESFCALLSEVLQSTPASEAVAVLGRFAERASNVFYLDEMPHARAAWTILREQCEAAGLRVPPECSPLGHPAYVENTAALRFWRAFLAERDRHPERRVLVVHGRSGLGKRRFLSRQAALLSAADRCVTNLLGVTDPDWSQWAPVSEEHILLLEHHGALERDTMRQILSSTSNLLLVLVGESNPPDLQDWGDLRIVRTPWSFPGFSARDWYRWTRASV